MQVAKSRLARQGQISEPAQVRRELGIRTGPELIWDRQENGDYLVRPQRQSLDDSYQLLGPAEVRRSDRELKEAGKAFLASRAGR